MFLALINGKFLGLLAILFGIDILMSYALAAMIVSFVMKAGEKTLKKIIILIGGFHGLIILLIFLGVLAMQLTGQPISLGDMKQEITLYHSGTWWEQVHSG